MLSVERKVKEHKYEVPETLSIKEQEALCSQSPLMGNGVPFVE